MKHPQISIIVPIYKAEAYIHNCIDSILTQTFTDFELILVNDGSPDNSGEICDEYAKKDARVRVYHKKNGGVAAARQTGLDAATGDYIIQFDSDDYVESNIIELLVKKAMEEEADIVICDFDNVYENHSLPMHVNPPLTNIELICKLFTGEVHSSLCNKLIKKELYKLHDINFTLGLNMCEDLSVMYRLVYYSNRISYVPQVLYHYRQNVSNSFSSQKMPLKYQQNRIQLLEQVNDFLNVNNEQDGSILRHFFRYLVLSNKGEMLLYGDINNLDFFKYPEMKFSIRDILSHPNLHPNFKIILLFDKLWLKHLVSLARYFQKQKKN